MKVVNKDNFVPSNGFVSVLDSVTEQVGYRDVKQQIEAFLMANQNLMDYRYRQNFDMSFDDVLVDDCEDIVDVLEAQEKLAERLADKQKQCEAASAKNVEKEQKNISTNVSDES